MLELRNVSKRFAGSLAVDNVSFRARPGRGHRVSRAQRVRQVDDDEDDRRVDRDIVGRDHVRWAIDRSGRDRVEAARRLRAGGAAPLRAPLGSRIPDHGRPVAGPAGPADRRSHRRTASAAGALRRSPCLDLGLFERHAPEGATGRGSSAQSRSAAARRAVLRA